MTARHDEPRPPGVAGDELRPLDTREGRIAEDRLALVEERPVIERRVVDRGGIRIRTHTESREETLRVPLEDTAVEMERVPIERVVETMEAPREEGDVTIIPIYEERLIYETKLVLVEEVRIRRLTRRHEVEVPVTLRRQVADVERLPPETPTTPSE